MLDYAKSKTRLHIGISPGRQNWIGTGAGRSGLGYNYVVWEHEAAAELYIDRGKDCDAENKAIFDALHAKKTEIEAVFGGPLEWQRLDSKRACRIRKSIPVAGYRDEERYAEAFSGMVDAMIQLEKSLKPHIQKLASEVT